METTNNTVVAVTVPSVAQNQNLENAPVVVTPLDELSSAIDDIRSKLRLMFDESNLLSRKVKEVALAQKQKERDFIQAKRAIERIRMAI